MKQKVVSVLIIFVLLLGLWGCTKSLKYNLKYDYESLNGLINSHGLVNRSVSLSEDNVFIKISAEDIVKKIEDKETFYVYFGSKLCPWCRSVIEAADRISRKNGIEKIYYVDIWDSDGNEILRDKYVLNDAGEISKTVEGTRSYYKLLDYFDKYLSDYTLTDSNGAVIDVGEKRIYAPNFMYVEDGSIRKFTTGTSDKQKSPSDELTAEIVNEEEEMFDDFFRNKCSSSGC